MLSQVLRRQGLPRSAAHTPLAVALAWMLGASSAAAQAPAHAQQHMHMQQHQQHQHPAAPASPPPLHYTSVIQDYKRHADPASEPWREANDRVGRIGGWRAYAREIQGSDAGKDAPAAGSHEGHSVGPRP